MMLTPGRLSQWDCRGGEGGLNKEPKIVRSDRVIHVMITCDSLLFIMTIYYTHCRRKKKKKKNNNNYNNIII